MSDDIDRPAIDVEREAFYDAEIAPTLLALGKKCQDRGLNLLALVEWAPGEFGRTAALNAGTLSAHVALADMAMRAEGNVDALVLGVAKRARKVGHGSVVLRMLHVPETPEEKAPCVAR